jgi:HAMP domain-containing protein
LPYFLSSWESLRRIDRDDHEIYQRYVDFVNSITTAITGVGEYSRLSLVSDTRAYYLVAFTLSILPEASLRLITAGNILRENLYSAETVAARWNTDLAEAQALGRRLGARPFDGDPHSITLGMLSSADAQIFRSGLPLLFADRDRSGKNLAALMEHRRASRPHEFDELAHRFDQYRQQAEMLSGVSGRAGGFNAPGGGSSTVSELLDTVSLLNTTVCQLWAEAFQRLETQVERYAFISRRALVLYLLVVFVSLAIALTFVILITVDVNRSVKSLRFLFKGLHENDLTLSLKVNSKDEFGELMVAFNTFLNMLRSTFGSFKKNAQ